MANNKEDDTVDNIKVFWQIMDGWDTLSYEDKLKFYWEYKIVDGIRIYGT